MPTPACMALSPLAQRILGGVHTEGLRGVACRAQAWAAADCWMHVGLGSRGSLPEMEACLWAGGLAFKLAMMI